MIDLFLVVISGVKIKYLSVIWLSENRRETGGTLVLRGYSKGCRTSDSSGSWTLPEAITPATALDQPMRVMVILYKLEQK